MSVSSNLTKEQLLKQELAKLLQSNFDADTKVCLTTLLKVLDNVLQQPSNPKVRSIRISNPAFTQKVVQRPGGVDYLLACGFERWTNPPSLLAKDQTNDEYLVLKESREDTSHLVLARRLLMQTALLELHMKAEDLPKYKPPPASTQPPAVESATAATSSSSSSFDPYRGHRFDGLSAASGKTLGPDGTYVSTTETQLNKLKKQQEKLEGKLQKPLLDRELLVIVPHSSTSSMVSLSHATAASAAAAPPSSDGSLLAQRMQRLEQERLQREEGGFTTKAMRDLQAIQKKKVYSHVQLRIQFADGSVLVGKFLPKETVQVVRNVILENCAMPDALDLDLYVSPPRRKLELHKTLQEEGLVPAAKVIGSWKVGGAPPSNASPGSFWKAHLLHKAPEEASTLYPTARPVVEEKKDAKSAKESSREDELMRRMMGGKKGPTKNHKDDSSKISTGGKPKWFKG